MANDNDKPAGKAKPPARAQQPKRDGERRDHGTRPTAGRDPRPLPPSDPPGLTEEEETAKRLWKESRSRHPTGRERRGHVVKKV